VTGATRRELLARAGLVAGAAGVVGAGGVAALGAGGSGGGSLPRVIHGADWRVSRPGVAAGTQPAVDATVLPVGRLVDADGAGLGVFEASVLPTGGAGLHLHRLEFADGTVNAVGPATLGDATYAVIGGTGRFSGASGSYHLEQRPAPSGGTARFTLDITTPGASNGR
jgi:hypothetical protein